MITGRGCEELPHTRWNWRAERPTRTFERRSWIWRRNGSIRYPPRVKPNASPRVLCTNSTHNKSSRRMRRRKNARHINRRRASSVLSLTDSSRLAGVFPSGGLCWVFLGISDEGIVGISHPEHPRSDGVIVHQTSGSAQAAGLHAPKLGISQDVSHHANRTLPRGAQYARALTCSRQPSALRPRPNGCTQGGFLLPMLVGEADPIMMRRR